MKKENNNQITSTSNKYLPGAAEVDGDVDITNSIKIKTDSAYCSYVSQRGVFIKNMSPVMAYKGEGATVGIKAESEGTSYSSRGSAFINDEELEGMFTSGREDFTTMDTWGLRHSMRSSPWTVRPDSAPLHEEDEDDDNKISHYSCSPSQDSKIMAGLPELIQCTLQQNYNPRPLFSTSEQRNEHIAIKLREIADNLSIPNKNRSRSHSTCSESLKPSLRRHSHSSFAEIIPCACGSVVDLILSLYNVYKIHSQNADSSTVVNSQSMANINPARPKINSRNRSLTQ